MNLITALIVDNAVDAREQDLGCVGLHVDSISFCGQDAFVSNCYFMNEWGCLLGFHAPRGATGPLGAKPQLFLAGRFLLL